MYRWQKDVVGRKVYRLAQECAVGRKVSLAERYRWQQGIPLTERCTVGRGVYRWQKGVPLAEVSRTKSRIRLKGVTGQFASLEEPQAICMDARVYCARSQLVAIGVATSREASRIMCRSVDN